MPLQDRLPCQVFGIRVLNPCPNWIRRQRKILKGIISCLMFMLHVTYLILVETLGLSRSNSYQNLADPVEEPVDTGLALTFVDLPLLSVAVETFTSSGESTFLINTLKSVFSSPEALARSFLVR